MGKDWRYTCQGSIFISPELWGMRRRNNVDINIAGILNPEFPLVSATRSSVPHAQDEYEKSAFRARRGQFRISPW